MKHPDARTAAIASIERMFPTFGGGKVRDSNNPVAHWSNEEESMKQFRQGDVLIERAKTLPKGAKLRSCLGHVVLAEGEATGHAHRIERADIAELYDSDRGTYLCITETTRVVHEEHGPVTLEPGIYRVQRQREYSPEEIRRVAD